MALQDLVFLPAAPSPHILRKTVHLVTVAVVIAIGLAVGFVLAVLSHPASIAQTFTALFNSMISTHLFYHKKNSIVSISFTSASSLSSTTLRSAHDLTPQSAFS